MLRLGGLPLVVVVVSFGFLLCHPLTLGRADESHLLHGARRVLDGDVLYRDFLEIITPLGFYFFAAVYRLFGTTLRAARVAMAVVEAIGAGAMFVLARRLGGAGPAALAAMVFVAVCVPVWPIASAHWMSTSLALLTAAVLLDDRAALPSRARLLASGVLTGVAICVQQHRGLFLALWLGTAIAVLALAAPTPGRSRRLLRDLTWGVGPAFGVSVIVLGHAAVAASPALMIDALYRFPVETYAKTMSIDIRWADVLPLTDETLPYTWHWLLRVAPVFPVIEAAVLVGQARYGLARDHVIRGCVCLLSLLSAVSVWYLRDFIHVAFVTPVLLLPGTRLLAAGQGAIRNRVPRGRSIGVAALFLAGGIVAVKGVTNVARAYAAAPVELDTAFGRLRERPEIANLYAAVARHVVREPDGAALAYFFPDDAWLYLTLPARDAARFDILLLTFPRRYIDEVTALLRARVPGTVALLNLPVFPAGEIRDAVVTGYDLVEHAGSYEIYVRRGMQTP
ncbi:MAG TPA: hypothetical protein VKU61_15060 [Candidatus Binatia bacterium]|nr:hypothetical protein [Candidatus Binatia bacterium]